METTENRAPSNVLTTQQISAAAQIENQIETIATKCVALSGRVQYESALLNHIESRFRKICAAGFGRELIKYLAARLLELTEKYNVAKNMTPEQCVDCAELIVETFPDMNIADFFSFMVSFRSGRFRSQEIEFVQLFNHIDESVIIARLKAYFPVRDRVLQAERNAEENYKSMQKGKRFEGVRQVEDVPETEKEAVHISEALKTLGFLEQNINK